MSLQGNYGKALVQARVAVVHEWLVDYSGSERVVEQILNIFPQADLFALIEFLPPDLKPFIHHKTVHTSFVQTLPFARRYYRQYLPLMPLAVEQFDLSGYDLVISSSHAVAKGVLTGPDQLHISYVHSPIRYAWDLQHQYLREAGLETSLKGGLARWLLHQIRLWDVRTANGVDHFLANSRFIARRIQKCYRRNATVIYPPVAVESFGIQVPKHDFYVAASRMVPYKRMDLIVEAFSAMPTQRLVVIGEGPEFHKVRAKAGENITFLGFQPFEVLKQYMQQAQAFVFAAEEDFGILPVEAQACGTPVIAFAKGGALETVRGLEHHSPTGVFFEQQSVESLQAAVTTFEASRARISPTACYENAQRFSAARFRQELTGLIEQAWAEFQLSLH